MQDLLEFCGSCYSSGPSTFSLSPGRSSWRRSRTSSEARAAMSRHSSNSPLPASAKALVQVPLGKVAGEMVRRQTRGQCARLRDRSVALVPCGFVRGGHGSTRCGHTAAEASEEAQCADGDAETDTSRACWRDEVISRPYGGTHLHDASRRMASHHVSGGRDDDDRRDHDRGRCRPAARGRRANSALVSTRSFGEPSGLMKIGLA